MHCDMLKIQDGVAIIESKVSKRRLTDTKKNETKRMISRANCNTMFLFFLTADNQISRNVHS